MAKYKETVCSNYIAFGICKKGRDASHERYCQRCDKYYPRAKVRHINKKRKQLDVIRKSERFEE